MPNLFEEIPSDISCQVALRIRPLKREELTRGYKAVATKVDDKVRMLTMTNDHGVGCGIGDGLCVRSIGFCHGHGVVDGHWS